MPAVADMVERRDAIVATSHRLAVDNAGLRTQTGERLDDQREMACEVIAGPAIQLHFCAVFAGDEAESVRLFGVLTRTAAGRDFPPRRGLL
jgi:hypothetical protein